MASRNFNNNKKTTAMPFSVSEDMIIDFVVKYLSCLYVCVFVFTINFAHPLVRLFTREIPLMFAYIRFNGCIKEAQTFDAIIKKNFRISSHFKNNHIIWNAIIILVAEWIHQNKMKRNIYKMENAREKKNSFRLQK